MIKTTFISLIVFFTSSFSLGANAFPELPFCPMGGPPGWMHRFMDRHDHNRPPVFYQPQGYYSQPPAYPPASLRYVQPPIAPANYGRHYGQNRAVRPFPR